MREDNPYPSQLMEDVTSDDELAARIARYTVLEELGYFGVKTSIKLAIGPYPPRTFVGAVRKSFSGLYGNTDGCSAGDIEVAMELTGSMDDILDFELRETANDGA